MKNIFDNAISSELFFVYALIALVIILIIVIVVLDKKESKKKPKNLFDTLNMKIIADPYEQNTTDEDNEKVSEEIIINQELKVNDDFQDLEPIEKVKIKDTAETLRETINELKNETYTENELDKTQAQIRVEEITKALEEAKQEELEEDKYQKFEEEQEKNAIISYNELKESFDRLYSENEKIQYLDDDEIPINIDELYELRDHQQKAKLDDFTTIKTEPKEKVSTSGFKNSPLISPVYGIQTPPVENNNKSLDSDIESTNLFLKNLKELKNNLE
ncbi:MAG: hypothetical protein MRZ42_00600 [Tenericutes bacterium]|nr:hypothetical protein [Mycoplasmatota bacterium]